MQEIGIDHLLEAAIPDGCAWYSRGTKRLAVRLVLLDRYTLRAAGRAVGVHPTTITSWVNRTMKQLAHAGVHLEYEGDDASQQSAAATPQLETAGA